MKAEYICLQYNIDLLFCHFKLQKNQIKDKIYVYTFYKCHLNFLIVYIVTFRFTAGG